MPVFLPGLTSGLGYGGASYAYSPYGSGVFPRLPVPTTGGYGGAPYGYGSYGSLDVLPPRLTGANSLDGYRVEIFFSEEMADNAALVLATNYSFSATHGVPLTVVSVATGTAGTHGGYTSVIVTHTGSTLGGSYVVTVVGATDLAGNPIGPPPTNSASFSAFGDTTTVAASLPSPDDGRTVRLDFSNSLGNPQNLLTEAEFSPGVDDTATYAVTTAYPVTPVVGSATQDGLLLSRVFLDVHPMTSTTYNLVVGPSDAFDYTAILLPDDDPDFTGVEIGTGTSTASSATGLLLSKEVAVTYGWSFGDTSGLVVPGSTYRVDFQFTSAIATITPSLFGSSLGTFSVSDGGIQVDVVLSDVAGVKQLDVSSGAYTASVVAAWDDGSSHILSLVRNIKGGFYSVLFDGTPILTFAVGSATGVPTYGAGAAFVLSAAHKVDLFKVEGLTFTASSTLFTSAWNFLHGVTAPFTGSAVLTRDRLLTERGPLVRGWGDATPARKDDVAVRVNSTAVEVTGVNPYVGEIYPTIPIPLSEAPAFATGTIEVGPAQPAAGVAQLTVNGVLLAEGAAVGWTNGGDLGSTATAIAAAITTHTGCSAVAIGSVVRVTAPTIGAAGNTVGLVNTSGDPNIAVSGATLSGGVSEMDVEADYIWFSNPPLEIEGLNTRGLTLNKWDRSVTHTPGVPSPLPAGAEGASQTGRFPMGVALGPYKRPSPLEVGHRYIGFQRDYSALLNEPTTLLTNQNPHRVSVGGVSATALIETASFDGQTSPVEASAPWTLSGVDEGVVLGNGSYQVVDASSGPYGIGTAAIYYRDIDTSLTTSVTDIARLKVRNYTADGVFTGVGFGSHNGSHLCVVGLLVVDTVQHVGVLLDAANAHLEEGWEIGPSVGAEALNKTQITIKAEDLPLGVDAGSRFRIASGAQAGVYKIAQCGLSLGPEVAVVTNNGVSWEVTPADSLVTITLDSTTPLPADVGLYGNDAFDVLFEVRWDTDLVSFRTYADFPSGSFQVFVGGAISAEVANISEVMAFPAETALLIPAIRDLETVPDPSGVVFWGSLSRRAMSVSDWDMVYYVSVPERTLETVQGVTVLTEMGKVPEDDPHYPWFITRGFGYAEVDASGDTLLLKATSAISGVDDSFSYARVEPFLSPKVTTDFEATFQVNSETLGTGDGVVRLYDTEKQIEMVTVSIQTAASGAHGLAQPQPTVSISGLQNPVTEGWVKSSTFDIDDPFVRGQTLILTKAASSSGSWEKGSLASYAPYLATGNILEGRLAVSSYTADVDGLVGPFLSADVPIAFGSPTYRTVVVNLIVDGGVPSLRFASYDGSVVSTVPFDWSDGEFHDYRLVCEPLANLVAVVVDDTLVASLSYTDFVSRTDTNANRRDVRGAFGVVGGGTSVSLWDSLSVVPSTRVGGSLRRTFGIWLGGDRSNINSYALPRTDGTTVPNSDPSATFEEMDWKAASCRTRLYFDPAWGVGFYRPDLPLPPTATEDFVTETTDPTAAWINVEYADLPRAKVDSGLVVFGSPLSGAITAQRWDSVRYRIRAMPTGYGIAPQGMVLNRSMTITSGEFLEDVTPEVVTLTSLTSRTVQISQSAMYADRVFVVQVGSDVLPATAYSFDPATQLLLLTDPLPSANYPVTVTFAPGKPITKTYLCTQPIEGSVTLLNEGTPPVPTDRDGDVTREIISGSIINDPHDVLDDAASLLTNDPTRRIKFTEDGTALYADLQFCEVEDGEHVHITTICDSPGPAHGLAGIAIDGTDYDNAFSVPEGPAGPWKGSPSIKGSATHFDPSSVLVASGGAISGGVLGPGTAILYPNARGPEGSVPPGMGMNQDFRLVLEDATPRSDTFDLPTRMGDNVPPTYAVAPSGEANPDGVPGTHSHGACVARMEDYGSTATSRLGPTGANTYFGELQILNNAGIVAGDTITLNGVVLTASAGAPAVDEFQIGATAEETVDNIRDAVNDTTNSFDGMCTAQVELPAPAYPQVTFVSGTALTFAVSNTSAFLAKSDSGTFSKRAILGGGMQMNGYEFILSGGAALPSPTVTTMVIQAAN